MLNELTRKQVEHLLAAIKRRYELQSAALKDGSHDEGTVQFDEKMSPETLAMLGIEVK